MKAVIKTALAMLGSADFFNHLRGALARVGLRGEETFGVGLFLALTSRFRPNPLRVAIREASEGAAKYQMRAVSKLLGEEQILDVHSELGWARFAKSPKSSLAFVSTWSDYSAEGIRLELKGNLMTRVVMRSCQDRIVETPQAIAAPFVCVSPEYPRGRFDERGDGTRWLSIKLPAPQSSSSSAVGMLDKTEISCWFEIQRLLRRRAEVPILLPEWGDIMIAQASQDERSASHVPAFIEAWKTMTLLRSFQRTEEDQHKDTIVATFEDLAATALLMRGVFQEGRRFPSLSETANAVLRVGDSTGVVSPITGKGVKYQRSDDDRAKNQYVPLTVC
jgi:hypothetical protein